MRETAASAVLLSIDRSARHIGDGFLHPPLKRFTVLVVITAIKTRIRRQIHRHVNRYFFRVLQSLLHFPEVKPRTHILLLFSNLSLFLFCLFQKPSLSTALLIGVVLLTTMLHTFYFRSCFKLAQASRHPAQFIARVNAQLYDLSKTMFGVAYVFGWIPFRSVEGALPIVLYCTIATSASLLTLFLFTRSILQVKVFLQAYCVPAAEKTTDFEYGESLLAVPNASLLAVLRELGVPCLQWKAYCASPVCRKAAEAGLVTDEASLQTFLSPAASNSVSRRYF